MPLQPERNSGTSGAMVSFNPPGQQCRTSIELEIFRFDDLRPLREIALQYLVEVSSAYFRRVEAVKFKAFFHFTRLLRGNQRLLPARNDSWRQAARARERIPCDGLETRQA